MSFPIQLSVIREVFRRTPRESLSSWSADRFRGGKSLTRVFASRVKSQHKTFFASRHGSPTFFRGADRDRTDDLRLAKPALSQRSYSPGCKAIWSLRPSSLVGQGRVELPTSRLSGVRSNHLSYWPGGSRTLARPLGGLGPWKLNRTWFDPDGQTLSWAFDPKSSS